MYCILMTLRPDLLELASAMFDTGRQTSLEEFFAGKEKSFSKICEKALKFNFLKLFFKRNLSSKT